MTNMEWCVINDIAVTDLYCTKDTHRKPTINKNSCYIIREVHGFVYSEFEDKTIGFDKVILDWLADDYKFRMLEDNSSFVIKVGGHHCDCNHDCDALYEAYYKGFFKGYDERKEEEKKKAEKVNNKKAIVDEMNEVLRHEFENCFGGIQ